MDDIPKKLDPEIFRLIVKHTPLVSIDLIVTNQYRQIMLGMRKNNPAREYWFVPGGRILKNETIRDAFQRITGSELGISLTIDQSVFTGVYEHIHKKENFLNDSGYGTHYVVMAFRLYTSELINELPREQHAGYKWFNVQDLLNDPEVHPYVKNYFNGTAPFKNKG
ncbi:MAG: GDP-mannose mannosyl hydrolase [Bacteroidales bacterium]|nr:GDP-mannose mannosyl hydrolase [Bacteroidales bacterium]